MEAVAWDSNHACDTLPLMLQILLSDKIEGFSGEVMVRSDLQLASQETSWGPEYLLVWYSIWHLYFYFYFFLSVNYYYIYLLN